ncbi:MAG: hypothetical protein LUO80_04475 [Methylococcaceae bacterium]|nr:hypothetical protein [Methylococcaceae bacterium]
MIGTVAFAPALSLGGSRNAATLVVVIDLNGLGGDVGESGPTARFKRVKRSRI